MSSLLHDLLFSFTFFFFCFVFPENSAFTQYFQFQETLSSFWTDWRTENISFLLPKKTFCLCSLLLRSLLWIRNLLLNFSKKKKTKQTSALHFTTKTLFMFFPLLLLTIVRTVVAVTRTSAAGHPLHQAVSFHFLSFHFTFSKVFSSFTFFMILCFSCLLFDVILYSFFCLVFTSFCHLFVFPTFQSSLFSIKKSLLVLSLLFRSALVLTLFLWALLFFNVSFFTYFWTFFFTQKTCHSFCVLVFLYSFVFFFFLRKTFFFVSLFAFSSVLFFRCLQCVFVHFFFLWVSLLCFFKEKSLFFISFLFFRRRYDHFSQFFYLFKIVLLVFPSFLFMIFVFFTLGNFFALCHALCFCSSSFVFCFNRKLIFLLRFIFHFWSLLGSHLLCLFPSSFLFCLFCLNSLFVFHISFFCLFFFSFSSFSLSHSSLFLLS